MSEVELVGDDVVVIDGGRVRAASTLADFVEGVPGAAPASLEHRYLELVGEL